jgi:hypothetical protein
MRIAIIGTRGIPNNYGGFEQCAENLSRGLVQLGHEVTVYSSHDHPWREPVWNGVRIVHVNNPEKKYGTVGQFAYDLNCIWHTRRENYDIILQLGYTSSSVWGWLLPRSGSIVTTNMDGLEWKRTKYSRPVRRFLRVAERLGVVFSDHLIADSVGIHDYLKKKYGRESEYIPYGANRFTTPEEGAITSFGVRPGSYDMLVARLEPENSIEIILDGKISSKTQRPFLIIGKHETDYGRYLKNKYRGFDPLRFVGGIYDINVLNNLRHFSNLYFHGHTVGGTNPSLLEAMASQALVCAHDNIFNKSILGADAFFFSTREEVAALMTTVRREDEGTKIAANDKKIRDTYNWPAIINSYLRHFETILASSARNGAAQTVPEDIREGSARDRKACNRVHPDRPL